MPVINSGMTIDLQSRLTSIHQLDYASMSLFTIVYQRQDICHQNAKIILLIFFIECKIITKKLTDVTKQDQKVTLTQTDQIF